MVNVAGVTSFPVGTKTEVKWGNSRLRVALALDVTGSMASAGKMDALKTAAKNLIDQLKNAASSERRRLYFDHPIQQGRPCRHFELHGRLGSLGPLGRGERHLQYRRATRAKSTCEALHTGSCSLPQYASRNSCENNSGIWNTTDVNGVWTPAPTAPGTAASPIATRIRRRAPTTTPRTRRRRP